MLSTERQGGIAFVEMNAPPVNAFGLAMRRALEATFRSLEADDRVSVIVLCSALPLFSGGADIHEFRVGGLWDPPTLPDLCARIEASATPFIAAMEGTAMGGALEIALACDYRIATPDTMMGLPEIKLGLLPGAGGTQRLPRIAGLETATRMILSGDPVDGEAALSCGLVDRLIDSGPCFREGVRDFASRLSTGSDAKRRCEDMRVSHPDLAAYLVAIRKEIEPQARDQVAPQRCLQSIEAACTLPFGEGLAQEVAGFADLLETPQSREAQRRFFATREGAGKDTP